MNINGLDHYITERGRERSCPDCDGLGIVYSDPDRRQLICSTCEGYGSEAERAAEAERKGDEERENGPANGPEGGKP
jgi:hypothetical protein